MNTRSGVWLTKEYLQSGMIDMQKSCSECGYESGLVMSTWKYCPICGARLFFDIKDLQEKNNGTK